MIYYEVGESSKSAGLRGSRERLPFEHNNDKGKDEANDKHRNHHRRERSRPDLATSRTPNEEHDDKRDRALKREKSKSRENLHKDEQQKEDRDSEKDRKSSNSRGHTRDALERKDSSRRTTSTRHIRRASELPLSLESESSTFLAEFKRNMDKMQHKSEPDLRELADESQKKQSDGRSSKQKKLHPAIALIKSSISARLNAIAKDREEKQRVRETAGRLRRHTISEAAIIFNFEPRETPTPPTAARTPTTPSQSTPVHSPVHVTAPATTPVTPDPESENADYEDSDGENSPDMVVAKSYTPDLMRYADVDLSPQLGVIGVN